MDMKKILQAMDGAKTKAEVNSSEMKRFLRVVKESDLNQPDPKYVEYAQLMAKYDMLSKEMQPDASGLGVEKGASPDAIASIDAIKTKAEQLAGPNLQAWEQARQKENTASMAQANANLPAMAAQLENAPAAQQSPEQIAYNQLRAQIDSYDSLSTNVPGQNTYSSVSPEVTANMNKMRTKLAQMAAALKAKGIDAEAEYDAPDPAVPAAAPVDLAKKYVDEHAGMSRFLSIVTEGKGPLNRLTAAESIAVNHYSAPAARQDITSKVLNVREGATPGMFGKYFKTVEQEFAESAERRKDRARLLAERVIERIVPGEEPAPGINRLTGKPNVPDATAPAPASPAGPSLSSRYGPGYEGSPAAYTITVKGQDYKFAGRDKQGPGTGEIIKVPGGAVGIRGLAPVSVELGQDGMFYIAAPAN